MILQGSNLKHEMIGMKNLTQYLQMHEKWTQESVLNYSRDRQKDQEE